LARDKLLQDAAAKIGVDQTPRGIGDRRTKNRIRDPGLTGKSCECLGLEDPGVASPATPGCIDKILATLSVMERKLSGLEFARKAALAAATSGGERGQAAAGAWERAR
jgi:hypothetical protein